jgi:hypothetical protein
VNLTFFSKPPGGPETAAEEPERAEEPRSSTAAGAMAEGAQRPWWRRVFGIGC